MLGKLKKKQISLKTSFMKPKKGNKWNSIHKKYTETGISQTFEYVQRQIFVKLFIINQGIFRLV